MHDVILAHNCRQLHVRVVEGGFYEIDAYFWSSVVSLPGVRLPGPAVQKWFKT